MEKNNNNFNAGTGIIISILGIIYSIMVALLPKAAIGNPLDPLYFPGSLGLTLIILGLALFLRSDKSKSKEFIKGFKNLTIHQINIYKMITYTCLSAVLYAIIFEKVGFVISTFIFMMCALTITNREKLKLNVIVALCFSIGIYSLFNFALGIPLPGLPL